MQGFRSVRDLRPPAADTEVDFGGGPRRLPSGTTVLDLRRVEGPVDWTQLDKVPHCRTIDWSGPDRGLAEALAGRPGIEILHWENAAGDLDLSGTHLRDVRLSAGADLRSVRLPASAKVLSLREWPSDLRVEAPQDLDLRLRHGGPDVVIPAGLRHAPTVWLWVGREVSAGVLSSLTNLRSLQLTFDTPPGILHDGSRLAEHPHLHTLRLDQAYDLDTEALPPVGRLELHGTRRGAAMKLRRRFPGLSVTGAKTEAWLAEFMDNPFRDWVHESEPFARAACAAYERARRDADGERSLRGLVADLSALNREYDLIDTVLREHAWAVFLDLAARAGIPERRAAALFDQDRDF